MCGSRIYDRALKWRLHPIPSRERDGWEPTPWLEGSRRFPAIGISSWSARDRTKRRAPVWRWPSGERASAGSGPCSAAWTPGSIVSIPSSGSGPSVRPTSPPDPDGPTLADKGHRSMRSARSGVVNLSRGAHRPAPSPEALRSSDGREEPRRARGLAARPGPQASRSEPSASVKSGFPDPPSSM
jgi:hypothetical protein